MKFIGTLFIMVLTFGLAYASPDKDFYWKFVYLYWLLDISYDLDSLKDKK